MRLERAEEPSMAVADGQRLVQAEDPLGVVGVGRAHFHAGAACEFDDLGERPAVPCTSIMAPRRRRRNDGYPTGYDDAMSISRQLLVGLVGVSLIAASCGGDDDPRSAVATDARTSGVEPELGAAAAIDGISTISAQEAAAITDDPPADLVVLDVRTPEEFSEGHLEGAVLVDFYDADFAEQLAALDPDVPYLVYCRSGNRSGQTLDIMQQLGFSLSRRRRRRDPRLGRRRPPGHHRLTPHPTPDRSSTRCAPRSESTRVNSAPASRIWAS